jgi:hypothetical protein
VVFAVPLSCGLFYDEVNLHKTSYVVLRLPDKGGNILYGNARSMPTIREERLNLNPKTVAKWRKVESILDEKSGTKQV